MKKKEKKKKRMKKESLTGREKRKDGVSPPSRVKKRIEGSWRYR